MFEGVRDYKELGNHWPTCMLGDCVSHTNTPNHCSRLGERRGVWVLCRCALPEAVFSLLCSSGCGC